MLKYFEKIKYVTASLITCFILLIIFKIEGLYPFTDNSIVQVDADYQFIPVLYRIWDCLHGNFNIIYDDLGFGNSIYTSLIIQGSLFSPLNLLLYFTTRANIINFFNIFVIIKICLLSLTTYIFINYKFKVNEFYKILFSILYSLSGWIMLNYFNIMWLDSVILFPLIIMFLDKLITKNNSLGYIITLALSLAISYYISFFILLFIIFYSFIKLYVCNKKEVDTQAVFRLGISTFIAILLASFSLLPAIYQTLISSRFDSSSTANMLDCFMNKSLYLMGSPLFIILFIKYIVRYKKEKNKVIFLIMLAFLFGIGLFVEPINLALHMGSHWSFPYRYSFILIFILMLGSLFYIEKYKFIGNKNWYWIFIYIGLLLLGLYFNNQYVDKIIDSQIVLDFDSQEVFNYIIIIFMISLILNYLAISFKNKYLRYSLISISSIFIIFIYASWTMYYSDGYFLTKRSVLINENIELPKDGRYKMKYTVYTPSHGFIYDVGTLDNWLHVLPSNEVKTYKALGYETSDTCIRSYGGTIFTDWLFNFKYFISNRRITDPLYTYIDSHDGYYLFKYNYNSGFGLEYDIFTEVDVENTKPFDLQNYVYSNMIGGELIKVDTYNIDNLTEYSITYNIDEKGFLYFYNKNANKIIDYIEVDGRYIKDYDNYIKDLGIYNKDIEIRFVFKENITEDIELGFISYDKIINLNNHNIIKDNLVEINSKNGKNLFLPINNIPGIKIYNNNKLVDIDNYLGNFVSIKLNSGINKIKIEYELPLLYLGIILSTIGVILLFLYKFITGNNIIYKISALIFFCITNSLVLYFYVYAFLKHGK